MATEASQKIIRTMTTERVWRVEKIPDHNWLESQSDSARTVRHWVYINRKLYEPMSHSGSYYLAADADGTTFEIPKWFYEELTDLGMTAVRDDYRLDIDGQEATLTVYSGVSGGLHLLHTRWDVELEVDERWNESTVMAVLFDVYPHIPVFQPPHDLFGRHQELSEEEINRFTDRRLASSGSERISIPKSSWEKEDEEARKVAEEEQRKKNEEQRREREIEIAERKRTTSCRACKQDPNGLCYDHDYGAC